jgi:hypothetical protein
MIGRIFPNKGEGMNKKWTFALFFLLLTGAGHPIFAEALQEQAASLQPSEIVGTWQLKDTDGSTFLSILKEDGTSLSNWGPGETGSWQIENNRVTVSWTDGWHDVLEKTEAGFQKSGYAPGVALTETPTNQAPAEKIKDVESSLAGRWVLQSLVGRNLAMIYRPDHTFGVDIGADGSEEITGVYQIEGDEVRLKDVQGDFDEKCKAVMGVYQFNLAQDGLHYTLLDDSCPGRVKNFKKVWIKNSFA